MTVILQPAVQLTPADLRRLADLLATLEGRSRFLRGYARLGGGSIRVEAPDGSRAATRIAAAFIAARAAATLEGRVDFLVLGEHRPPTAAELPRN